MDWVLIIELWREAMALRTERRGSNWDMQGAKYATEDSREEEGEGVLVVARDKGGCR